MKPFQPLPRHPMLPEGMRLWGALHGGYSWVISHEPGEDDWTEAEKAQWVGYMASYCRDPRHPKVVVDGGPFRTMAEAEAACDATWKAIRRAN